MLGDPRELDRELRRVSGRRTESSRRSEALSSSIRSSGSDYQGKVAAEAGTLPALVERMKLLDIPSVER